MDTNAAIKEIDEIEKNIKKACIVINIAHDYIETLKKQKEKIIGEMKCSEV